MTADDHRKFPLGGVGLAAADAGELAACGVLEAAADSSPLVLDCILGQDMLLRRSLNRIEINKLETFNPKNADQVLTKIKASEC